MSLLHIAILALVQGITEFLPVSSSGHLLLTHALLEGSGNNNAWGEDLVLDLAVHVGSLVAVLLYFRKDIKAMLLGMLHLAQGKREEPGARLAILLILASIPALTIGFLLHIFEPPFLRSIQVVGWCTLIYGILLWVVDSRAPVKKEFKNISLKDACTIGAAQALALVPGTSRSGITMTAARWLGFARADAARFSFLLSIIATAAAGTIGAIDLIKMDSIAMTKDAAAAALFSFIASWLSISILMKFLQTSTFKPFAIYRVGLAIILLTLIYTGYFDSFAKMSLVSP